MNIPEILVKAAAILPERGLHKGDFSDPDVPRSGGAVCTRGAINIAVNGDPEESGRQHGDTADQAAKALADHLGTADYDPASDHNIIAVIGL